MATAIRSRAVQLLRHELSGQRACWWLLGFASLGFTIGVLVGDHHSPEMVIVGALVGGIAFSASR